MLFMDLKEEDIKAISEIIVLADRRKAAADSKRLEKSGGYNFTNHAIPTNFCFSSATK